MKKRLHLFYQHKPAATAAANIATYISGLRYFLCPKANIYIVSDKHRRNAGLYIVGNDIFAPDQKHPYCQKYAHCSELYCT